MPPVNLIDPATGKTVAVDEAAAPTLIRDGWEVEGASGRATRLTDERRDEEYGGVAGGIAATGAGVLRGVTLGGSDALLRGLGEEDEFRNLKEANPGLSTAGDVVGQVGAAVLSGGGSLAASAPAAAAARLGNAIRAGSLGGAGLAGKVARGTLAGVAEGAIVGTGAGVSELALSADPLTAERIASSLSSNALFGASVGGATGGVFSAGEHALGRAAKALREVSATRRAVENVPEDLVALDAKGLRAAAAEERAALQAEAKLERESLESLRKPQREELAEQIRTMHQELATERPIFQAVAGADVRKIAGVGDIASQLNKSYRGLRGALDNPIRVAEDPGVVLGHLQMRQSALESLQAKAPEIQAALGSDARAMALEHVDGALAQTREQIATIGLLSKSNPVTSARLTQLQSGASPRLTAIEAAQDALTNAPEIGLIGKGAKAASMIGGTALAHMIPGVGVMAPFVGQQVSEAVGRAFGGLAKAARNAAGRTAAATEKFLNVSSKATPYAPAVASKVLGAVRFGDGPEPKSKKLVDVFRARSAELRSQTMYDAAGQVVIRPEARAAIADRLAPIAAVNPLLADKLETIAVRKAEYVSSKIPRRPEVGGLQIGPDNWRPSDLEMRSWARTVRAAEDPGGVEDRLAQGVITPEDGEAYRTIYPERFAELQAAIFAAAPSLSKTLPLKRKIALSVFTGVPLIPALQPNVLQVLQGNYAQEPGTQGGTQAPTPTPSFGALGSLKSIDKPTPAQAREE